MSLWTWLTGVDPAIHPYDQPFQWSPYPCGCQYDDLVGLATCDRHRGDPRMPQNIVAAGGSMKKSGAKMPMKGMPMMKPMMKGMPMMKTAKGGKKGK